MVGRKAANRSGKSLDVHMIAIDQLPQSVVSDTSAKQDARFETYLPQFTHLLPVSRLFTFSEYQCIYREPGSRRHNDATML